VTEVWALLPRRCSAFSATAVNRPLGRIAPASTVSFRYTPVTRRGCAARNAVPTLSIAAISTRRVPKAVIGIAPVPSENAARRGSGRAGIRTVVQNETARLCHQTPGQDKSLVRSSGSRRGSSQPPARFASNRAQCTLCGRTSSHLCRLGQRWRRCRTADSGT
jgi:hypothetical protein